MNATTEMLLQDDTAERLITALNRDDFVLFQQRVKPLRTGFPPAVFQEILIRFKEEEEKLLPPGTFIPVLEASHLMHLLDRWVVNRLIKWMHGRLRADPNWIAPRSSINLSNDSLTTPDFPVFLKQQLSSGRVSGHNFTFEIGEEDAHHHLPAVRRLGHEIWQDGCRLILTGYSGAWIAPDELPDLGVESVKLDIDIVTTLHNSRLSEQRASALQQLCAASGIKTIAEFVEKQATLDSLKRLGVDYVQGYGIAMPAALACR